MIVLVHGFTTPSHCFTGMFDALAAEGHRVVTYDLWGRGWSDAPAAKQDASLFASQLAVRTCRRLCKGGGCQRVDTRVSPGLI